MVFTFGCLLKIQQGRDWVQLSVSDPIQTNPLISGGAIRKRVKKDGKGAIGSAIFYPMKMDGCIICTWVGFSRLRKKVIQYGYGTIIINGCGPPRKFSLSFTVGKIVLGFLPISIKTGRFITSITPLTRTNNLPI